MPAKGGRRSFIRNLGMGTVGAAVLPSADLASSGNLPENDKDPGEKSSKTYNGAYTGEFLKRVAFPIGGLGAGMFCMEGTGAISHMSIRNHPDVYNEPSMFAAISIKGLAN